MVHKFGTLADLDNFPSIDSEVENIIASNLKILDENYGADREIDKDDGGYILYATLGTSYAEILSWFNYEQFNPEYVDIIDSTPPYCCALYLVSNDYGVVILTALADTPKEIRNEIQD